MPFLSLLDAVGVAGINARAAGRIDDAASVVDMVTAATAAFGTGEVNLKPKTTTTLDPQS